MSKKNDIEKINSFSLIACNASYSFCQVINKNDSVETLSAAVNAKDSATIIKDNNKAHATLSNNTGVSTPSTTSGTMNSTVNPNSQVIIPFGQKKKKNASVPATTTTPKN